jgi:hypothetical protein
MTTPVKSILFTSFIFLFSLSLYSSGVYMPSRDTVPPPPSSPDTLNGPEELCVGETAQYTADFPMGCYNIWYVDDSLQGSDSAVLEVTWETAGNHIVKAYCNDTSGLIGQLEVTVLPFPEVFLGNDTTLQEGETILLDAGNPGSLYLWSTGDTTQTLLVSETGYYWVEVTNDCGEDVDTIFVDILTNVSVDVQSPVKLETSPGTIRFSGFTDDENVVVYSLSGKALYNGRIKKRLSVKGRQVVLVVISNGFSMWNYKVYIP